jgi:large subunit ribosomal protein L25
MGEPTLAAKIRTGTGKGVARKLRANNQIPAIFYGPSTKPVPLALDLSELQSILRQATSENIILDLQIRSDDAEETRKAMLKDLQLDPVRDVCLHADFCEISMDKPITVDIPIRLLNTPIGVTNGGILQHPKRELSITCLPDKLIDFIEVDVMGLDIGDSLHIQDIKLPMGIATTDEGHLPIAAVAAPAVALAPEEAEEAEGAPGEEGAKASAESPGEEAQD